MTFRALYIAHAVKSVSGMSALLNYFQLKAQKGCCLDLFGQYRLHFHLDK